MSVHVLLSVDLAHCQAAFVMPLPSFVVSSGSVSVEKTLKPVTGRVWGAT